MRLVKGAYWDSEIAWAKQKNWPIPVFLDKAETDANYERLSRMLLESHDVIDAAFGSHNLRSLAHAIVAAKEIGVPANGYEMQMLYGMAEPVRQAIVQNGQRVRVYLPVGELLPGISYLIRRLMENTSNTSFLRQTYADKKDIESLIKAPAPAKPADAAWPHHAAATARIFVTKRRSIFRARKIASASLQSLAEVRGEFRKQRKRGSGSWLESVNPADPNEIIGRVRTATDRGSGKGDRQSRRAFFPSGATRRRKSAPRFSFKRRSSCASGAGISPHGKFSKSARAGARRTPMFAKRSIISTIMLTRCCVLAAAARDATAAGRNQYLFLRAARHCRGDRAVEFSSGDSHRHDCGGIGHGQLRVDEAGRTVAADGGASVAIFCHDAGLPDDACQLLQGGGEIGAPSGALAARFI